MTPKMIEQIIARAIEIARMLVGTKEELGQNHGKVVDAIESEFGMNGVAWCVMFVLHCYRQACKQLGAKFPFPMQPSSQQLYAHYEKLGMTYTDPKLIKVGDIIIWQHDKTPTGHAGMDIVAYDPATERIGTVEGNTSSGEQGSQSNGDGVYERSRNVSLAKFTCSGLHLKGFIDVRKVFSTSISSIGIQ